jgi:double-stranded uracil-DNA glycosylase
MIHCFDPIAGPDARVLVLGTVPGQRSLDEDQYYAHPRNAFWPIMQALFAGGAQLVYASRIEMLVQARVAVWDVLHSAERSGSLDAAIASDSEVPNDIAGFLAAHPAVATVFFNGAKAEELFQRHVAATVDHLRLRFYRLPSTSPANAIPPAVKLEAWRAVVAAAGVKSP